MNNVNVPLLEIDQARVWTAEGAHLLRDITWSVRPGEHWALLGPNGAGKSTLLSLAGAVRHPSAGAITLFGGRFGHVDIRPLRRRVGVVDPALRMLDWLTAEDVVLTGISSTIQPLWHLYGNPERQRARELLDLLGCAGLADREIRTCSQGERQRVRIARALMPSPDLLLLDEPATGLDLPAREALLGALTTLAETRPPLATIAVAHHLEDLPSSTTHALLLRQGTIVAVGPAEDTLNSDAVSACFGLEVRVRRDDGRWSARATAAWNGHPPTME